MDRENVECPYCRATMACVLDRGDGLREYRCACGAFTIVSSVGTQESRLYRMIDRDPATWDLARVTHELRALGIGVGPAATVEDLRALYARKIASMEAGG